MEIRAPFQSSEESVHSTYRGPECAKRCIEYTTDDEIMCMHGELQGRINREIKQQEEQNLAPVEKADLALQVSCVEELQQLCRAKAILTQLPIKYTVSAPNAEVDKESTATVAWSRPTKWKTIISFEFKSLVTKQTSAFTVDATNSE